MRGSLQSPRGPRRAFTLVELVVAATVMLVLAGIAAPSFLKAMEQTKADVAGAKLRAIWAAERMYYLNEDLSNRTYTNDLSVLKTNKLIDASISTEAEAAGSDIPYYFEVEVSEDGAGFTVQAVRCNSASWSGTLQIDQNGDWGNPDDYFVSSVDDPGHKIRPSN